MRFPRRLSPFVFAITLALHLHALPAASATRTPTAFSYESVVELARQAAAKPFAPQSLPGDHPLASLNYDQYRDIRFNPDAAIWRNQQVPFRLELLPAGFMFKAFVNVSIIEGGKVVPIRAAPSMYTFGKVVPPSVKQVDLRPSGLRIRNRLNTSYWDEFLVFQGASYFRAIGKKQTYGASARGLTLRTADPQGEEFPAFTDFWIERPTARARGIVVLALLESQSATGAYRFSVLPGTSTVMDVNLTLFARTELTNVGIGPVTSMFLFDESDRNRVDDFRDEVHDSDGLQILQASGEQVWRPLTNPSQLQVSSFTRETPKMFGLLQRSRRPANFSDLEARYETRPNVWIEPTTDWGAGSVTLVEIPTERETVDNIVAYWRLAKPIPAGHSWKASYRLRWNAITAPSNALAVVSATRTGPSLDGKRRIFVVDLVGRGSDVAGLKLDVNSSQGRVSNQVLQPNPITKGLRASFELDPGDGDLAELRLRVLRGAQPISETWLYRWTPS
jgi:periplasmic glucans biosynthesis protein